MVATPSIYKHRTTFLFSPNVLTDRQDRCRDDRNKQDTGHEKFKQIHFLPYTHQFTRAMHYRSLASTCFGAIQLFRPSRRPCEKEGQASEAHAPMSSNDIPLCGETRLSLSPTVCRMSPLSQLGRWYTHAHVQVQLSLTCCS